MAKSVWYEAENKTKRALLGYLDSISAYNCYLEDKNIEKGSS